MADYLFTSAKISDCGKFRYELRRVWDRALPPAVFIMLNPSTADGNQDDPTIRRCVGFAKREGCGTLIVVNLGAGRATKPNDWMRMPDPQGPLNPRYLKWALEEAADFKGIAVCAWGSDGGFNGYHHVPAAFAREVGQPLLCFGKTMTGMPLHPLYLEAQTKLVPFTPRGF